MKLTWSHFNFLLWCECVSGNEVVTVSKISIGWGKGVTWSDTVAGVTTGNNGTLLTYTGWH